jgi:hypothetical protein
LITKLVVLNGTEGHKFEVGTKYTNTDKVKIVTSIIPSEDFYVVNFEDKSYVNVVTDNVLVFYAG